MYTCMSIFIVCIICMCLCEGIYVCVCKYIYIWICNYIWCVFCMSVIDYLFFGYGMMNMQFINICNTYEYM